MAPTTRRSAAARRSAALRHAVAGFTVGLVAVTAGFLASSGGPADGPVSEASEQAAVAAAVRMTLERAPEPVAAAPAQEAVAFSSDGQSLLHPRGATRVVLPSVGIDVQVRPVGYAYRGGSLLYDVPQLEAGHYVGSAEPGERGNMVIGGHVSRRSGPAVFAPLPGVAAGDLVEVYQGEEVYRYSVTEIRVVDADATAVMARTQDATLTLITCFPDDGYAQRLVVVGKLL
ncbi:MAG: sortase [Dehalococcoidia bacterium]|nr:sortase [Dehalococcoidia bacterium]